MEAPMIHQLCYDGDRAGEPVEGVFYIFNNADRSLKVLTKNLVHGQEWHQNEIFYQVGDAQYRVINPIESMLGLALVGGIRNIFVRPGSHVLYLANDDSAAVTISHLSDIVGLDGVVCVVPAHKTPGDRFDRLINLRANVKCFGDNFTHSHQRINILVSRYRGSIDVVYCDVGLPDQVERLFSHVSWMFESGGHFVAFIKANKMVYRNNHAVVVPNDYIFKEEMRKMKELGFKRVEALSLGQIAPDWLCVVGLFNFV